MSEMDDNIAGSCNTTMSVPWCEGTSEDFSELHNAIRDGKTDLFKQGEELPDSGSDNLDSGSDRQDPESDQPDSESEEEIEPSPDDTGNRFLWTAQHGKLEELKTLLNQHPTILHFKDIDGYTALHRACYSNQATVAIHLIMSGADINATTEEDWTPLHSACRWNAASCVEMLLAQGANINATTHGGQTPLHLAAFCANSRETIQLLLMHPHINRDSKNCQQDSAQDIAKRNKNSVELFDLCKSHFRDLNND